MNRTAFLTTVRARLGKLEQSQVNGLNTLLDVIASAPLTHQAYMLATAWWETAKTCQPVREAFWKSEDWRRKNLRYFPWYGRGYVQLTWEDNYRKADHEMGLAGALIAKPDLAMNASLAARIMRRGMAEGWFSGDKTGRHTLARHLPGSGTATRAQYIQARRIINLLDRADEIEDVAQVMERALRDGGVA